MVEGALSLFWIKKKINKKCKKRKKGKKKKSNTVTYNLNKHAIINIFTLTPSPPPLFPGPQHADELTFDLLKSHFFVKKKECRSGIAIYLDQKSWLRGQIT